MGEEQRPELKIIVNADGVKVVQFCGKGFEDEPQVSQIYERIKHLIQEIDTVLRGGNGSNCVH